MNVVSVVNVVTFSNCAGVFSFLQQAQTLYLHSGWLPLATCTGGLVPSSTCTYAVLLHAQIATCTVMMVHGGGSGVIEGVPWDSSM